MSEKIRLAAVCPKCGQNMTLEADVDVSNSSPQVRSKLQPIGQIQVYRITSDQIAEFVIAKAHKYAPNANIDVIPIYTEKKHHKNEAHRAYASMRIAFSEDVIEKKDDLGLYGKIGESDDSIHFQPSIFTNLVKMYSYKSDDIRNWLKSYKTMEDLEDTLGITESYLNEIKMFAKPRYVTDFDNTKWIIFAAAAENIIQDMLTDINTGTVPGKLIIQDVYQISSKVVEFIIYIHPEKMKFKENSHIRQILLGEEKPKK